MAHLVRNFLNFRITIMFCQYLLSVFYYILSNIRSNIRNNQFIYSAGVRKTLSCQVFIKNDTDSLVRIFALDQNKKYIVRNTFSNYIRLLNCVECLCQNAANVKSIDLRSYP